MKVTKKIMESFEGLLPSDKIQVVEEAINNFVEQVDSKYKEEYEKTLEESFKEWDTQLKQAKEDSVKQLTEAEQVAYQGYNEALEAIKEKETLLETQKVEFDSFLEEQYAQAAKMIEEERGKNEELEQTLYESYTQQIEDIKEDLVGKINDFLESKVEEITECVKKEMKNSPEVLESKVAFERIKEIVASSMTSSDFTPRVSNKMESLETNMVQLEGELKALKAKNLRLVTENQQMKKSQILAESTFVDNASEESTSRDIRKEVERRVAERIAENVEGRGKIVSSDIISESFSTKSDQTQSTVDFEASEIDAMRKLAGITR